MTDTQRTFIIVWIASFLTLLAVFKVIELNEVKHSQTVTEDIVSQMCRDTPTHDAYVSKSSDGYICFMQNVNTKKISKTALVISE